VKPTALLLHSGGMSSRQWRKLAELLAPTHDVVAPDFLGSGDEPVWPIERPFHFRDDVARVRDLVARCGPVDVVGHSYGGLVGLTLAAQARDLVRRVAVFDPVCWGVIPERHDWARFLDDGIGGTPTWFETFVDYWNGPGTWQAMPEPARAAFLRVGAKVYLEVKSLLFDRTPASTYVGLDALVLTGERTPAEERQVVDVLAETWQTRPQVIAGAGHMGPITHAPEVNRLIRDFLAR
jgi:pimeloyl-ACP methyl ester carboxylesterase